MIARILAFCVLISALLVPNVAGAAHLAGHARLSSAVAEHLHHDDHSHERAEDTASADGDAGSKAPSPEKGLAHDHGSSHVTLGLFAGDTDLLAWISGTDLPFDGLAVADGATRLQSLLRPPRAG